MKLLPLSLTFALFTLQPALAAFNLETLIRAAHECDPKTWKNLPLGTNFDGLDSDYAKIVKDLKIVELPGAGAKVIRTEVSGTLVTPLICREKSFLDDPKPQTPLAFRLIWKLEDYTSDPEYRGWITTFNAPDEPEGEHNYLTSNEGFNCLVRYEDFIKDYRTAPIKQLCKGQSAKVRRKFEGQLKALSERLKKENQVR